MAIEIQKISGLPVGIDELDAMAGSEGFGMVQTLISNFSSGANRFNKRGEALYAAYVCGRLAGVGGINIDPYFDQPELGRIRHLYVHPAHRRSGIGRSLMTSIEQGAAGHFEVLQLFTPKIHAAQFYESLSYLPVQGEYKVSHAKPSENLRSSDRLPLDSSAIRLS